MRQRLVRLTLSALVLGLVGCATPLIGMQLGSPGAAPYSPPEGRALLVIARPLGAYPNKFSIIVDEHAHFVASVSEYSHAIVAIEPGHHSYFVASDGRGAAWMVQAEAGRVYVVSLNAMAAAGAGMYTAVHAVFRENAPEARERGSAILESTNILYPHGPDGPGWVNANRRSVTDRMRNANEVWNALDDVAQSARTLRPSDGFAGWTGAFDFPGNTSSTQGFQLGN